MRPNLSATLAFIAGKLDGLRFAGTDQNPHGIRDLLGSCALEAERMDKAGKTLFLVTTNYDWEESIQAFRTRAEAVASITDSFECESTPDSKEFWQEVSDNYEAGKWKGFQFLVLDTETLAITDCEGATS